MGAGMYKVRVIGELDSTRIRKELDNISRTPLRVNGALGGIGVSAGKAVKGVKGLNGQLIQTNKNIKKINGKNLNSVASASEKSAKGMKSFASETLGVTKRLSNSERLPLSFVVLRVELAIWSRMFMNLMTL